MPLILIIEDNEAIRENTVELLQLEGYDVISAINGEEGISLFLDRKPDLILSDVHMPQKNGYDVLEAVKCLDGVVSIPFVFLTADSEKKDINNGLLQGASGYLVKPFSPEALLELVKVSLGEYH